MLRDYQIDICSRMREALEKHRSVMMQMPTGTGKTAVLASLVMKELKDERIRELKFSFSESLIFSFFNFSIVT